jgi:hypothetical protein
MGELYFTVIAGLILENASFFGSILKISKIYRIYCYLAEDVFGAGEQHGGESNDRG